MTPEIAAYVLLVTLGIIAGGFLFPPHKITGMWFVTLFGLNWAAGAYLAVQAL